MKIKEFRNNIKKWFNVLNQPSRFEAENFQPCCFRFETSSVHFMSREIDISHGTIDDLASKVINYGKESKEKDQF